MCLRGNRWYSGETADSMLPQYVPVTFSMYRLGWCIGRLIPPRLYPFVG